jgi:hypothetical protein
MSVQRGDIKKFREVLNKADRGDWRNGAYHQKTRPYGDYLYAQDREKFQIDMMEWIAKGRPEQL